MKRVFIAFICIGVIYLLSASTPVKAVNFDETWSTDIRVVSLTPVDESQEAYQCSGRQQPILTKYSGLQEKACVFGEENSIRVARIYANKKYIFLVSFPYQHEYFEVKGLCLTPRCVYSSSEDALIAPRYVSGNHFTAAIYKNFSESLERVYDPLIQQTYFQFSPSNGADYIPKIEGGELAIEAISVSQNGRWALLEAKWYGFLRIKLESLEVKRVIAPGPQYGMGSDPVYELAISNDGNHVALMGSRLSTNIYTINEECGDYLTVDTQYAFSNSTLRCRYIDWDSSGLFPGSAFMVKPYFSAAGNRLSFTIFYWNGEVKRAVIGAGDIQALSANSYIALGDSFSSGEGELDDSFYRIGTNSPPFKCHVSRRSYPYLVAHSWNISTESVACSGARTTDIIGSDVYDGQKGTVAGLSVSDQQALRANAITSYLPGIIRQIDFVHYYQPGIVTLGIGGNDAGLMGKLLACLSPGVCEWASDRVKRYATSQEIAAIYPNIRAVLQEIKQSSPLTKVIVVGYPQIIDDRESAQCDAITSVLLNAEERVFINKSISYLNRVIFAAASAEGIPFIDAEAAFNGSWLCGDSDRQAMNGVRFGDDIAPLKIIDEFKTFGTESFHPTPLGHYYLSENILNAFTAPQSISSCTQCIGNGQIPPPPEYWHSDAGAVSVRQIEDASLTADNVFKGDTVRIATIPFQFMTQSEVSVALHSTPRNLSVMQVNEKGGVEAEITIPADVASGYHVLHLFGTAPTGELIDVYKVIAITSKKTTNNLLTNHTTSIAPNDSGHIDTTVSAIGTNDNSPSALYVDMPGNYNAQKVAGVNVTRSNTVDIPSADDQSRYSISVVFLGIIFALSILLLGACAFYVKAQHKKSRSL